MYMYICMYMRVCFGRLNFSDDKKKKKEKKTRARKFMLF